MRRESTELVWFFVPRYFANELLSTYLHRHCIAQTLAYWDLFASVAGSKNPDLHLLPVIAKKLIDGIESSCYAATDGVWTPLTENAMKSK